MLGKQKQMRRWIAIAVAIGLVCASHVAAQKKVKPPPDEQPITYATVVLSNLEHELDALNQLELGDGVVEVVGRVWVNSGEIEVQKASHWMVEPSGAALMSFLRTLPWPDPEATVHSRARDVNNDGVIIGQQWDSAGEHQLLLWPNAMSDPIPLPLPEGAETATARSINDEGIVVGYARTSDDSLNLVAWKITVFVDDEGSAQAEVQDARIFWNAPDVRSTMGGQIANSGFVSATVDVSPDPQYTSHRALRLKLAWNAEQQELQEVERTPLFDVYSQALGVNEAGIVCGVYTPPGENTTAFAMTVSGALLNLQTLPAMKSGGSTYEQTRNRSALALNNASPVQIVGNGSRSYTKKGAQWSETVPLRWDGETRVTDLRTVTDGTWNWLSVYLSDINDAGWIIARPGGVEGPVLLIPKL